MGRGTDAPFLRPCKNVLKFTLGKVLRNISVYLVINFMHNWNGKRLPLISMNGDTLRNQFLIDLLKFKGNEAKDNIPQDIQEVLNRL
ncbi:hypothetical protein PVAP13_5NG586000 [Panicum virgatum]|uniref:Uncharacterized protein n=1 Tax=Panicum virgatum TaxID=38727 RepID=A0A8T0S8X3_PANVG|nr:hypothetical protein PVAP13_5NG586000 [Panicum virgatum]